MVGPGSVCPSCPDASLASDPHVNYVQFSMIFDGRYRGTRTHTVEGLSFSALPLALGTYMVGQVGLEPTDYAF